MACPNCHMFHAECKAICCGMVPIPENILRDSKHLYQRPIIEVKKCTTPDGDFTGDFLPITADMKCVFLKNDYSCAIYDQRPDVCKKFGDESHLLMTCRFQTKDGEKRSALGRKMQDKRQEKYFKNMNHG